MPAVSRRSSCLIGFGALALVSVIAGSSVSHAGEDIVFDSGPEKVALLELFTSQGCSSCPPAEAWLSRLATDCRLWRQLVPVAFHVDYWDDLGWRDVFADKRYSARQRNYRRHGRLGSVYTPGFVLNGREWRGWFRGEPLPITNTGSGVLRASLRGDRLKVRYRPSQSGLTLHMAITGSGLETRVLAGENSGRRLPHDFVALTYETHRSDNGNWEVSIPDVAEFQAGRLAVALWVTGEDALEPLQASGGWLSEDGVQGDCALITDDGA
jgi:hypothetical protein